MERSAKSRSRDYKKLTVIVIEVNREQKHTLRLIFTYMCTQYLTTQYWGSSSQLDGSILCVLELTKSLQMKISGIGNRLQLIRLVYEHNLFDAYVMPVDAAIVERVNNKIK